MDSVKIAIIGEDTKANDALRRCLKNPQYSVKVLNNVNDDVLELLRKYQTDLVMVDIPSHGSASNIKMAKEIYSDLHIPIVFVIYRINAEVLKCAKTMKPFGYVRKPFDEKEVECVLEIVLNNYENENARRKSEERYRNLIEKSSEGIWLMELKEPISLDLPEDELIHKANELSYLSECNNAMARMYGYESAEELLGSSVADLQGDPNEPQNIEAQRVLMRSGYRITDVESYEIDKEGNRKYFLNNAIGIIENGHLLGVWGTQRDITKSKEIEKALRESEKMFRTLCETTSAIVFMYQGENIYYINSAAENLTGYSREELCGRKFWELVHPDSQEMIRSRGLARQRGEKVPSQYEICILTKNGEKRWIEITANNVEFDGKQAVLGTAFDITERKLAEEKIKASLKEKEVLLREIHHRVDNNMQVIISLLRLQSKYLKDNQYREILNKFQNRIYSMALVHEQMYQSDNFTTIDLGTYIHNLTKRLVASSHKKIGINVENLEKVYLTLELAVPLGIVINELINNSLMHAFPASWRGKKKIRISARQKKKNKIELVVGDNGVGFPKKFDFKKTESLGLKLVTILVEEQLNGKIKLLKGKGTTFSIIFNGSE